MASLNAIRAMMRDSNGMALNPELKEEVSRDRKTYTQFKNVDELSIASLQSLLQAERHVEVRCGDDPTVTLIHGQHDASLEEQHRRQFKGHTLPNVEPDDYVFMKAIVSSILNWNISPVSGEIDIRITNRGKSYVIRASGFDIILVANIVDGIEGYVSLVDREIVVTVSKRNLN